MAKIFVLRLSAMGDVAMLIPLIYGIARANPEHEFTLVTQPFLTSLLVAPPDNLEGMAIDIRGEERHLWGLLRYSERLRRESPDVVIDLHNVLRTKLIRWSMPYSTESYHLCKPRKARAELIAQGTHRLISPVPPMSSLYRAVCLKAGLRVPEHIDPLRLGADADLIKTQLGIPLAHRLVGIAPFASTESKTYDLELMEQVVKALSTEHDISICLFGGGKAEREVLERWASLHQHVYSLAGQLDLGDELSLISTLQCMVSMDSANMHLASMVGTPVISVWCATHPYSGFLGHGQRLDDCLTSPELGCQPCSIFGRVKHCIKGNMPCRTSVSPEVIIQRIKHYIEGNNLSANTII